MIETHLSFANTWECDENGHINVQFFFKRFEEAADVFAAKSGLSQDDKHRTLLRHVRFHNEVHAADSLKIESGVINEGEFAGQIGHRLINTVNGKLCTTALDTLAVPAKSDYRFDSALIDEIKPRGLPGGSITQIDTQDFIAAGKAMVANHTTLRHHDLDVSGNFLSSRVISMFTDGAPHVWERAGVTTQWLNQNNFGRVAVEIKLNILEKPKLGSSLQMVSRVSEIEGRTFRIDHQIEEIGTDKTIALGCVRCLVMSLETRRAVSLPDNMTMAC